MNIESFKINIIDNDINIDAKVINNDNLIKLYKILNELNLSFTVDTLGQVVKILLMLYLEDLEISNDFKLIDRIKFNNIIESQNFNIIIQNIQKLFLQVNQENVMFDNLIKTYDKLNYNDVLDMIYQASIKLYEKIKVEMIHEDFNLSIQGGLNISAMRQMADLKSLTMGSLKTMTLWNFYFVDN